MSNTSQRAYQRDDMALRLRRPPEEYVSLLSQNEQEFRNYVHSFENNPLFDRLMSDGVVHKVRLRGKIPRGKYEEFMDSQLLAFLKEYRIESFPGWEHDFLSPNAPYRVLELSQKYGIPSGTLLRHLRYMRSSDRGAVPLSRVLTERDNHSDNFDQVDSTAGGETVDLSETIEATREFVERYNVSEQDFLDLVLGGEATADELTTRFGCSLREAEELLEATDRVYLAQTYETEGRDQSSHASRSSRIGDEPVAFVQIVEGQLALQFDHDSIYAQRYRIKRDAKVDAVLHADARDLLTRARFINQRLSALSRLITTLCGQQIEYLSSGDLRHLKPLAQADLARQLGEHPSTVSRLIRGKSIETHWGKVPLLFLCQSKTDVVARLIAEFPDLTDQAVVSRLREDFDCQIARRTVAYHRGKRVRRNKRHTPKTEATGAVSATSDKAKAASASKKPRDTTAEV